MGATGRPRDGRRLAHSLLVAQEDPLCAFFQGIFKSGLVQKYMLFKRYRSQDDCALAMPWEMASGSRGKALVREDSLVSGRQPRLGRRHMFRAEDLPQATAETIYCVRGSVGIL